MESQNIRTDELYDPGHLSKEDIDQLYNILEAKKAGVENAIDDDPIVRGLINAHLLNTINQRVIEPEYDLDEIDRDRIIFRLQSRYRYLRNIGNDEVHKWERIQATLEKASDQVLRSIDAMEKAGHEPCIYYENKRGFYIGTCSKETPEHGRDCTLNEKGKNWDHWDRSNEKSAVEMAHEMDIKVMNIYDYRRLLENCSDKKIKRDFDEESECLVISRTTLPHEKLERGFIYGKGFPLPGTGERSKRCWSYEHSPKRGWRGSFFVKWAS